jgi:hypothetical protein
MEVAQLAFFAKGHFLPPEWLYGGKSYCQIKP